MIEAITGPMFSGKTEELVRRLRLAKIAGLNVQAFKPKMDERYGISKISSHDGNSIKATPVEDSKELLAKIKPSTEVVGIDEAQFFDEGIIDATLKLEEKGLRIILAFLNLDFRGEPFKFRGSKRHVGELLCYASKITKLNAICTHKIEKDGKSVICGEEANFTQRIIDGKPAHYNSPTILIGGKEYYEARCKKHHAVPGKPERRA